MSSTPGDELFEFIMSEDTTTVPFNLLDEVDVNCTLADGRTPLMVAAVMNKLAVCRALLDRGAQVDTVNGYRTALCLASKKGHIDVVRCLVKNNAGVNQASNDGTTPLFEASQHGRLDIIKYLVANNADVNQVDNDGATPLYTASEYGRIHVVKYLLAKNADVNQADNDGYTPLFIAS